MTIVDTIADAHYRDKVALAMAFAELLNDEARELAKIGVDVIQFDEPDFDVYMKEVTEWGIMALHRASEGLPCKTAVHICYGYGIKANIDWKESLGAEWRQYEAIFPALQRAGSTRSRSNAPEPRFRSTYSAFCRTRKSCSGRSMSPATASRHRRKSRKRSSGRRALFHWNDCIPARTAAWHR